MPHLFGPGDPARRIDHARRHHRHSPHAGDPVVPPWGQQPGNVALSASEAGCPVRHEVEVTLGWEPQVLWRVNVDGRHTPSRGGAVRADQAAWHDEIAAWLRECLVAAEQQPVDPFVVVARAGQQFMQCLWQPMGWRLEKREGDEGHHYVASVHQAEGVADDTPEIIRRILAQPIPLMGFLDLNQANEAMGRYLLGQPEPDWLEWSKITV